jgi:hypothetical protein
MIQAGAISTGSQPALLVAAEDWISSKADRKKRLSLSDPPVESLKNLLEAPPHDPAAPTTRSLGFCGMGRSGALCDPRQHRAAFGWNRQAERFVTT